MSHKSLAWLGTFPSHWDVMPNKALIKKVKRPVKVGSELPQLLSLTKQGVIVRNLEEGGKFPENFDTYQIVKPGDLVTCLFDVPETPRTIGISWYHGMITGAYDVFEFTDRIHPKYFEYVYLYLDDKKALSCFYTGLRNVIRTPTFMSIPTPVPPLEEQRAIADYLDSQISKFSKTKASAEALSAQIKQHLQSSVYHFTRGGIPAEGEENKQHLDWVGEFPNHWKKVPNKALIQKKKVPVDIEKPLPKLLSLGRSGVVVRDLEAGGKFPTNFETYQVVQPGDLVMCLFDVPETPRTIGIATEMGMITSAYDVFEFRGEILPEFFLHFYTSLDDRKDLSMFYTGLRNVIRTPTFLSILTPVPPLEEQMRICGAIRELKAKSEPLDGIAATLGQLLDERVKSLVAEVVMGRARILEI